ncbi:hypothetical protein [Clostridium sp.]|uniref:hypothetical protein n=1 Tax=Clostridium sp. TaxID=1506 RepID=UPI002FC99DE2
MTLKRWEEPTSMNLSVESTKQYYDAVCNICGTLGQLYESESVIHNKCPNHPTCAGILVKIQNPS